MTNANTADMKPVAAGNKRILVVDDNAHLLELFREALSSHGYAVETAPDGSRALELINRSFFNLVISDIHMPNLNGIELLVALRRKELRIPIIMISGLANEATVDKAIQLGSLTFLKKPIDMDELCRYADEAVSGDLAKKIASRVLVVDDNPDIREILTEVLGSAGFIVVASENGRKGLEAVSKAEKPYDYAMVDIHMPEMGGINFIGELKKASPATMPIIMTGEAEPSEIQEAYSKGGYSLIRKPFDIHYLVHYFAQLNHESNNRKNAVARQEHFDSLPFYSKAYVAFRDKVVRAPRDSKVKKAIGLIAVIILFSVFAIALIQLSIYTERYLTDGTSKIDNFINDVLGYLERDEEREMQRIK